MFYVFLVLVYVLIGFIFNATLVASAAAGGMIVRPRDTKHLCLLILKWPVSFYACLLDFITIMKYPITGKKSAEDDEFSEYGIDFEDDFGPMQ